ncbi:hypothetical protein T02_799 [Trichinella nativa]|uniref:Uncharacterized protein n=1 Tax=Trichinella nativa TaxID=6335 RepID=A0A0V1KQM4_9BILA|nr:hypothetical protein T02_799 [Trichinella nativa]
MPETKWFSRCKRVYSGESFRKIAGNFCADRFGCRGDTLARLSCSLVPPLQSYYLDLRLLSLESSPPDALNFSWNFGPGMWRIDPPSAVRTRSAAKDEALLT